LISRKAETEHPRLLIKVFLYRIDLDLSFSVLNLNHLHVIFKPLNCFLVAELFVHVLLLHLLKVLFDEISGLLQLFH
jgi:hypothetical protein